MRRNAPLGENTWTRSLPTSHHVHVAVARRSRRRRRRRLPVAGAARWSERRASRRPGVYMLTTPTRPPTYTVSVVGSMAMPRRIGDGPLPQVGAVGGEDLDAVVAVVADVTAGRCALSWPVPSASWPGSDPYVAQLCVLTKPTANAGAAVPASASVTASSVRVSRIVRLMEVPQGRRSAVIGARCRFATRAGQPCIQRD